MKKIILAFIITICSFSAFCQKDTAKAIVYTGPVKVQNTSVSIFPPAYFRASDKFNGFIHDGAGATIQVNETTGRPYPVMAQAMANKENLEKQGITLISQEDFTTSSGKKGILIVIGFSVKGPTKTFDYERMVFLTGDYDKTIIINMNYPTIAKSILFNVLKQSLLSVNY